MEICCQMRREFIELMQSFQISISEFPYIDGLTINVHVLDW